MGSGWVTQEAYETFVGRMIAEIKSEEPFDGVYLCLHGAMAARGVPRPEAELARRLREVVGPKAFIAATFDPHGNEDEEFLKFADMAFALKYFPHYDGYLQGERAARTLVRAIKGDYKPSHTTLEVPIISPTVLPWTGAPPWMDLVQRALIWEARQVDIYVNVFFGFPFADVPECSHDHPGHDQRQSQACRRDRAGHGRHRVASAAGTAHLHQGPWHRRRRRSRETSRRERRDAGRSRRSQRPLGLRDLAL
jgi:microcystin degradation protein MlrC